MTNAVSFAFLEVIMSTKGLTKEKIIAEAIAYIEESGQSRSNRSTTTPSPKTQALGKRRGLDYT